MSVETAPNYAILPLTQGAHTATPCQKVLDSSSRYANALLDMTAGEQLFAERQSLDEDSFDRTYWIGDLHTGIRKQGDSLTVFGAYDGLAVAGLWQYHREISRWVLAGDYYGDQIPNHDAPMRPIAPLETNKLLGEQLSPAFCLGLSFYALEKVLAEYRGFGVRNRRPRPLIEADPTVLPAPGSFIETRQVNWFTHDFMVGTADGRKLAVRVSGNTRNKLAYPIFLLHGSPGGCRAVLPPDLPSKDYFIITYDRPGYGESDRHAQRSVADEVADITAIADAFNIPFFSVIGRSGGAPRAIACAALEPMRTMAVLASVSPAPPGLLEVGTVPGLGAANAFAARQTSEEFAATVTSYAQQLRTDPWSHLRRISSDFAQADWQVITDPEMAFGIAASHFHAMQNGPDGWIDDREADWGFDLSTINREVELWTAEDDPYVPPHHGNVLLQEIPEAHLVTRRAASHFSAMALEPFVERYFRAHIEQYKRLYSPPTKRVGAFPYGTMKSI